MDKSRSFQEIEDSVVEPLFKAPEMIANPKEELPQGTTSGRMKEEPKQVIQKRVSEVLKPRKGTMAELICFYDNEGATLEEIAFLVNTPADKVGRIIEQAKEAGLYDELAGK